MPSRYTELDTDEERLPQGMSRIGYDADTQTYTYRDADGSLWEGPSGSRYGNLTKVARAPKPPTDLENIDVEAADAPPPYNESEAAQPFLDHETAQSSLRHRWADDAMKRHWRAELMPLLNFFFILALFLMGVFWFLGWMARSEKTSHCPPGSHGHQVQRSETCWSIANMHGLEVDRLREANDGINCDLLRIGAAICVPARPKA